MSDENQNPNENPYANPPERNHTLHYNGFLYTQKNKDSTLYWCKFYRSEKCKVKLNINDQGAAVMKNEHTEKFKLRNWMFTENQTHEVREEMVSMIE